MEKLEGKAIAKQLVKRLLSPVHLYRGWSLQSRKNRIHRTEQDPQLKLYSRIFPSGFLHLGYFDDVDIPADAISLAAVEQAQLRYAERVLETVLPEDAPILDVGCGMGGLIQLLQDRNIPVSGLTPDIHQVEYLRKRFPNVSILHSTFEALNPSHFPGHFGAVINSESLQYLDLDLAFLHITKILRPGGKWIICDYLSEHSQGPQPSWARVLSKLSAPGFRLVSHTDITPHILPSIRFIRMLGERIGIPILEFISEKVATKNPGLHYLIGDTLQSVQKVAEARLSHVQPERFADEKSYRLVIAERHENTLH